MNTKKIIIITFGVILFIVAMFLTVKKDQKNVSSNNSNNYGNSNNNNYDSSIPVMGLNIGLDVLEMNIGQTTKLNYKMDPINASNPSLEWKSSNINIVKVDNNGNITAISAGDAIITITSLLSKVSDNCHITVIDYKITGISLSVTNLTLKKGDKYQINPILTPVKANKDYLVYTSNNSTIVSVTKTGEITALNYGTAIINVQSGNIVKSINVNIPITNLNPSCPNNSYYLSADNTLCIQSTKQPSCSTGYRYDDRLKSCIQVANPVCPTGTIYSGDGICKQTKTVNPVCNQGSYNSKTKKCLIKTTPHCTKGVFNSKKNKCVDGNTLTSIKCYTGTYNSATKTCNKYVSFSCPSGYSINKKKGTCEITIKKNACPIGMSYDKNLTKCVQKITPKCAQGSNLETNGYCTGISTVNATCPSGYSLVKGSCLIN